MKAALFDLDGVIIDTEPQYTEYWRSVGRKFFPDDKDFALKLKGQTLTCIFDKFFSGLPEVRQEVCRSLEDFERTMDYPYVEGAVDYVSALRKAGIQTAIVTSSNQEKMECLWRVHPEIRKVFSRIFTAEDTTKSKPAPDCYILAAKALGVTAEDCYVFEDSFNGLQAARASGAYVVGLSTSNPVEKIRDLCDEVIPDFVSYSAGLDG